MTHRTLEHRAISHGASRMAPVFRAWTIAVALGALGAFAGCSASHYRKKADEEVYEIIRQKRERAGFAPEAVDIERPADTLRRRLLERLEELREETGIEGELPDEIAPGGPRLTRLSQETVPASPLDSDDPGPEMEPLVVDLAEALAIAAENSRDLQREKENVYLAALNLTLERNRFDNLYFATASGDVGQDLPEQRSGIVNTNAGFTRALASGANVMFDIGATLFRAFVGGADDSASSLIDLSITQPLLRGAGRRVVQEPLTQSERDALYAIRSFERFKKTLAVRVASDLYRVIQQLDTVRNARSNYDRLIESRERIEALAEAGRTPQFEVDQARQDELRERNRYFQTLNRYETSVDAFKLTLGIPTDVPLAIDEGVLERLTAIGLVQTDFTDDAAIAIAVESRLDLQNTRDEVDDADRRVFVARDGLQAGLSVSLASAVGNEGNKLAAFEFGDGTYLFGADLDLPIERTAERNAYRSALISLERARRAYEEAEDQAKSDVRRALRDLDEAEESYRIQQAALELAARRVESTELLQQAGRASVRDVLEAQEALVETQDGLTAALIDHTIARLELLRDLGLLTVDQEGLTYDASTDRTPETDG